MKKRIFENLNIAIKGSQKVNLDLHFFQVLGSNT